MYTVLVCLYVADIIDIIILSLNGTTLLFVWVICTFTKVILYHIPLIV